MLLSGLAQAGQVCRQGGPSQTGVADIPQGGIHRRPGSYRRLARPLLPGGRSALNQKAVEAVATKEWVRIGREDAEAFARDLFERAGVEAETAATVAAALIEAELEGHSSHGLLHAPTYLRRILAGTIARSGRPRLVHGSGAVQVFDVGLALGHPAAEALAQVAVAEARRHGLAAVAARSATHFGVAGRYARMIAEAGMAGIVMCNTRPMMPAPGGKVAVVGNNPLAIAVPCAGAPPIVFDMAMSATAMGRIRQAAQEGKPIAPGLAVDSEGHETTDAAAALAGMLLPAGGAKGFGLALMVDLLCALAGGAAGGELNTMHGAPEVKADCSWLMLALDPQRFGLAVPYAERVAGLAAQVRGAAPEPALALPGDRRHAARRAARDIITLAPSVADSLETLSLELGGGRLPARNDTTDP